MGKVWESMIKQVIKKIVGEKGFSDLRGVVLTTKSLISRKIQSDYSYKIFGIKGKNVFFGYYDLNQFSSDNSTILVHVIPKDADPSIDSAEIGMFQLQSGAYSFITKTHAWCWQQGSRLRWHPTLADHILYNDAVEGHYVCIDYDLRRSTISKIYEMPLYDIDKNFTYGLSLDFMYLQEKRPGYGYNNISVKHQRNKYNGIYKFSFINNEKSLILPYDSIIAGVKEPDKYEHYLNHISISPDGNKFIFFHIYNNNTALTWYTRLLVADQYGNNLSVLEDQYKVSHYTWVGNDKLIITCYAGNKQFYEIINLKDRKKTVLSSMLNLDGHPSIYSDSQLISDTYPMKDNFQSLLLIDDYDCSDCRKKVLARMYHNPFFNGEKRCDLHPRLSADKHYVSVDTSCFNGIRQCIVFDLNDKSERSDR